MPDKILYVSHLQMTTPKSLFISYAREDTVAAKRLYAALRRQPGLSPWLDSESLQPGARWSDEVLDQIETADFILILLSKKSVAKSGFVQREVHEALDRLHMFPPTRRVLIPIRLEPCQPAHRELRKLHYLDMFPSWGTAIAKLLESMGVREYTHNFVALGSTKHDTCRLAPLGTTFGMPRLQVLPVNVSRLPPISAAGIPIDGFNKQAGTVHDLLNHIWSQSVRPQPSCYRKSDWRTLSIIMFTPKRTVKERETFARILRRQWALAQESPNYDASAWLKFYGFIHFHVPLPVDCSQDGS